MERIVEILMRRDGEERSDAESIYNLVRQEIQDCLASGGSYDDIEDILYCEVGLEMDYIFEFL